MDEDASFTPFEARLLEVLTRGVSELERIGNLLDENHVGLTTTLSTAMDLIEEGHRGHQDAIKGLSDSQDGVASAISAIDQTVQDLVRRMPQ